MLVLIKSAPRTEEADRGLKLARDTKADVVLLQDGVYLARQGELAGFEGKVYIVKDDLKLRGLGAEAGGLTAIDYTSLVDLITGADKVVGMI